MTNLKTIRLSYLDPWLSAWLLLFGGVALGMGEVIGTLVTWLGPVALLPLPLLAAFQRRHGHAPAQEDREVASEMLQYLVLVGVCGQWGLRGGVALAVLCGLGALTARVEVLVSEDAVRVRSRLLGLPWPFPRGHLRRGAGQEVVVEPYDCWDCEAPEGVALRQTLPGQRWGGPEVQLGRARDTERLMQELGAALAASQPASV
ncbi:MAG: hypothetical protein H6741_16200 [Alphaproteobacteria bacterium]|nr:hypothetical protein [Alphaproteobacteria bacterium]MCB9794256.1 hypothetical protein [Alphaproteobacteria bacterium]